MHANAKRCDAGWQFRVQHWFSTTAAQAGRRPHNERTHRTLVIRGPCNDVVLEGQHEHHAPVLGLRASRETGVKRHTLLVLP